jgi:hypothetical protein
MIDFGSDVLKNIVIGVALIVLGWLIRLPLLIPIVFVRRRRQMNFFGVTKQHPRQIAYLSTLFVLPGGSTDFRGTPRSFSDLAVADYELRAIPILDEIWEAPLLDGLPSFFRAQLARADWRFGNIELQVKSSPRDKKDVKRGGSILTIGSQFYNSAGDLYLNSLDTFLVMEEKNGMVIRVRKGKETDKLYAPFGQINDLAIIERAVDTATGTTVFFLAGLGINGTLGAVYHLAKHWNILSKKYKAKPFALCLGFKDVLNDPNAFMRPTVLFEAGDDGV